MRVAAHDGRALRGRRRSEGGWFSSLTAPVTASSSHLIVHHSSPARTSARDSTGGSHAHLLWQRWDTARRGRRWRAKAVSTASIRNGQRHMSHLSNAHARARHLPAPKSAPQRTAQQRPPHMTT
jgi:hypothetical protein